MEFAKAEVKKRGLAEIPVKHCSNCERPVPPEQDICVCGYNFEEGKEYLIYASLDAETGKISTNSCMGNLLLEESKDEINELNDLIEPVSRPGTNDGKVEPIQKSVFSRLIDWIKSLFS